MRLVKMFTSSCSPFCCGDTLARWRITCSTWSIDRLPLSLGWRASGGIQRSLMYARKSCICVSDVRRATLSSTPVTPTLCIYTVLCIPKVAQPDMAARPGRPPGPGSTGGTRLQPTQVLHREIQATQAFMGDHWKPPPESPSATHQPGTPLFTYHTQGRTNHECMQRMHPTPKWSFFLKCVKDVSRLV